MVFSIDWLVRTEVDALLDCSPAPSNDDSANKQA